MNEKKWYNQSDVVMGVGVIAIVAMLIIPLPGFILDLPSAISLDIIIALPYSAL